MALTVYVFDRWKAVRKILSQDQVTALIHDESNYSLHAEIDSEVRVVPGEFIGFRCVDGKFRLFSADSAAHDDDRNVTDISATDAMVAELQEIIAEDSQQIDADLHTAIMELLPKGMGWIVKGQKPERMEKSRAYYTSAWQMIRTFEQLYDWRIVVYYEFSGGQILHRVIETMPNEPIFRGRILHSRKDASKVYITKKGKPITRLYVLGPAQGSQDVQTNLTIADAEWSVDKGDPVDKPKGQTWIEDPEAVAKYGLHTSTIQINGIEKAAELIKKGWEELKKLKEPKITADATVADVEMMPGHSHQMIRLGDLIAIRLQDGTFAAARVIAIKRDYIKHWLTKITIGDKKDAISYQVASLIASATHTFERLTIYKNRFHEDEALIQLNAEFIQANAKDIELNAEQIRLNAEDIRLNAEEILVKADKVELEAYVRVDELEAEILSVVDNAYVGGILSGTDIMCNSLSATESVWTEYISAYSITAAEIVLGASPLYRESLTVVTGIDVKTNLEGHITAVQPITTKFSYVA